MRDALLKRIYRKGIRFVRNGFDLKVARNGKYGKSDILSVPVFASVLQESLTTASNSLSIGKGRKRYVPCTDDVIYHFENIDWELVLENCREIIANIIEVAKENGDLSGPQVAAIDPHLIPRYRKKKNKGKKRCEDIKKAVRTNQAKGTSYVHKIVTCQIVGNSGRHYILDALPADQLSQKHIIVREFIRTGKERVNLKTILMDREHFTVKVINVCKEEKAHFVIGAIKNKSVKEIIKKASGKYYHVEENFKLGDKENSVTFNLIVVAKSVLDKKYNWNKILGRDKYFVFATDLKVKTLEDAIKIANIYGERWGIETGHREWEKFRAITCSHVYSVRLFLILLAMILYNVRLLINTLFSSDKMFISKLGGYTTGPIFKLIFQLAILARYKKGAIISLVNL